MNAQEKKTILLVEDDGMIMKLQKKNLEKYGYNVVVSSSGEEAVRTATNATNIDLILMDIDLGLGIDGTQAAEIILKDHDIPVVFLSSHTEPEVVEKTEKITSYGYVVKNSSNTVLDASMKMAFKLFDAKQNAKAIEENLRTHQIELKMQNDEFLEKQVELEASRAKFFDLYETAPVGFFTINEKGIIVDANLTAASHLGAIRAALLKYPLSMYILKEDQHIYYNYRKRILNSYTAPSLETLPILNMEPQSINLRMLRLDGTIFPAFLHTVVAREENGDFAWRVVFMKLNGTMSKEERIAP